MQEVCVSGGRNWPCAPSKMRVLMLIRHGSEPREMSHDCAKYCSSAATCLGDRGIALMSRSFRARNERLRDFRRRRAERNC